MIISDLNLTGKRLPTVRILLAIKSKLLSTVWFYITFIIFKFLGLIIITSNFIPFGEENLGYKVTSILRSITLLGIFGKTLNMTSYSISCVFIFLFLIIFFICIKVILNKSKADGEYLYTSEANNLIIFISIIFQVLLICSQHVIEYLSFIFLIQFNTGVDLSNSLLNNNYLNKEYLLFQNTTTNLGGIIILLLNATGIIIINLFNFFSIKIINEPFYDSNFPIRFKLSKISSLIYMIISNLQGFNYIEIFIQDLAILKTFKLILLGIIMGILLITFLQTYYMFNFYNKINYLINFLLNFAFFSSIIDLTLYFANEELNNIVSTLFVLIMKIIISLCFTYLNFFYNEKLLMNRMNKALFQNYQGEISKYDLNCLFYLMNIIFGLKNKSIENHTKFYEIIIDHKNQCVDENCKCKNIFEFKHDKLFHDVNLIIESIFVNLNLGKDPIINMMFSEYLYYQKESTLFSWSILNTYISKNYSTDSQICLFYLYVLILKKVHQYEDIIKKTENYVHFIDVFSQVSMKKYFEKKIFKIMKNFREYVGFKEQFDNSVKVDYLDSKIEASVFKSSMKQIVEMCSRQESLYKEIKSLIKKNFLAVPCKSVELAYKLFTFFIIFNKKTPQTICRLLCFDSSVQVTSPMSVQRYFNKTFYKFFGDKKAYMNMIIEINKIFKIKYINYKLCQALGYSYNKLINDDIHQLFPLQLRESHKKVLINHFLIQKKVFFRKKTFAFTQSKNMFPLDLMVSTFPGLKKNLQAIVSIQPIQETETRSFFFVLTEFFELIAISENFDKIYNINFEVIDKLGINVLKLFDIEGLISTKFKTHLDEIQKERHEKQFNYLYSLSNFLFNQNNGNDFQGLMQLEPVVKKQQKNDSSNKDLELNIRPDGSRNLNGDDSVNLDFLANSSLIEGNNQNNGSLSIDQNNAKSQQNINSPYKLGSERRGTKEFDVKNFQKINLLAMKRGSQISTTGFLNQINKNSQNLQQDQQGQDSQNQNFISDKKIKENTDYFSVVKDKGMIINNLEQLKNRFKDTETGYKFVGKLNESITKLKKSYESSHSINKNIPSIFEIPSKATLTGLPRSGSIGGPSLSFKTRQPTVSSTNSPTIIPINTNDDSNIIYSENFQIKVLFRKINDAPFFIINVKEKTIFKAPVKTENKTLAKRPLKKQLSIVKENAEHKSSLIINDNNSNLGANEIERKKKTNNFSWTMNLKKKLGQKSSPQNRRRSTKIGLPGKLREIQIKVEQEKKKNLEKKILSDPRGILKSYQRKVRSIKLSSVISLQKIQEEQQNILEEEMINEKKKSLILNLSLTALLLINLLTAIIVYIFKDKVIKTMQDIFYVQFWNLAQENSLLTLHSSIISFVFIMSNFSSFNNNYLSNSGFNISLSEFKPIIEERSNFHRNNFANLFSLTKLSNTKMTELENLLYSKEFTFQTLILTWDSTPINQTFIDVVDYICSNTRSLSIENSFSELISDLDNAFLYHQFKNLKNKNTKSRYSKLIYYFNQNFLLIDDNIRQFGTAVENAKIEFNQSTKNTSNTLEITNIILSFFSICLIHFTLDRSDKGLFKILLTMFLNLKKDKNSNFKATFECQIMRQRLQMYEELLKVFNVDTLRNFDDTLYLNEEEAIKFIKRIDKKNSKDKNEEAPTFLNGLYNGILSGDASKIKIGVVIQDQEADRNVNGNSSYSFLRGPSSSNDSEILKLEHKSSKDSKNKDNSKNSLGRSLTLDKTQPSDSIDVITSEQILTMTKNYTINFIKQAKILISIIFCFYIFFILANLITNAYYLNKIEDDIKLISSFIMKYPAAFRIFNMIRLMILNNDMSYVEKYKDYQIIYDSAFKSSQVLYDSYSDNLPQTFSYYETIISQNYDKRSSQICFGETTKEICKIFLRKDNGLNKEGINVAASTVMQNLNNVYKDYLLKDFENIFRSIEDSRKTLKKYFFTDEFLNINLEMEYVFEQITRGLFSTIDKDMNQVFNTVLNLEMLLGIFSILLNLIIILYLIIGFFSKLRMSMNYISYSAKKFNRAMYEL